MRALIIFGLVIVIYGMSVFGGFVQDDRRVILGDPNLGSVEGVMESWISPYYKNSPESGAYRPLTSLSLSVDALIFGVKAWGFRLVNVLLYGVLGMLVYELMKRIWKNTWWAFWVALVYVVLPIHAEAVSNIVGRGELLAGIMTLSALILMMDKEWGMGILCYFLAILSKESAIVWGAPLMWMMSFEKDKEKKVGLLMILVMGMIGYFVIRWGVLGEGMFGDSATMVENPLKFVGGMQRIMVGIGLVAFGVWKTVMPVHLSYDYSFNQLKLVDFSTWWFGLGALLIILSVWMWRKNIKAINWGLAFLWLPLLVTGNILKPIGTIFGERLWLMPSLGVVIIVFYFLKDIDHKWLRAVLTILVFVFGARAFLRNIDWLSERNLFVRDAKYVTGSVMAQNNAAAMFLQDRNMEKARVYLERASNIYPEYPELMNNWGIYYWWNGDLDEAKLRLEECLKTHPGNGLCEGNLSDVKRSVK